MTLLVVILKTLAEISLMLLFGQFILALLAGSRRQDNPVYRLFEIATSPVVKATRAITPKVVIDRHVPLVSFFLLIILWCALTVTKIYLVRIAPMTAATGG
ncbi:MAG: hypothetical protein ACK5VU_00895 [Burkholderiales bacterium]